MRHEYKAALLGGIPLAVSMFCVLLMVSPGRELELVFLLLSGGIGALFAYLCYKSSPTGFSLKKATRVGASVGVTAGGLYFASAALLHLIAANSEVVLSAHSISLAVIGVVQLAVASGLGGLSVGLMSKWIHARTEIRED